MVLGMTEERFIERTTSARIQARSNWLSSLNWQVDFYLKASIKSRVDSEFDWPWLYQQQKNGLKNPAKALLSKALGRLHLRSPSKASQEWLNNNAAQLWEARELLEDEVSKLLFDAMLTLRCSSYGQFYYPRIDFDDFVTVVSEKPFDSKELPLDYLGLPLRLFELKLQHPPSPLTIVSTKAQINLLNSYRQYFIKRGLVEWTPVAGDVVLDCGACIGEISALIAGLVGIHGEVHLFDPIPLHARYCELQASLNPTIAHVLIMNLLAVGDASREATGLRSDSSSISPGGLAIDSFSMTSLDDYVINRKLSRVNLIKMDIEGAEMAALEGATQVIKEFKPRLAISTYHKPEDLWEIPHKLKAQNSNYKLFFGHHSPTQWESVYYAA
jgi:FkbM family methyltransferase